MSELTDLSRLIEMIGKQKGIEQQIVIDGIVQGMLVAAQKKYGSYREIEARYNEELGEVELHEFKEVVKDEDFIDDEVEIKFSEAEVLDPEAQLGDSIGVKLDTSDLGRIAAQTARQIVTQQVRDAEREIIYKEFEERKGEIFSGIARRVERGAIVVDMGRTEAYIPSREQILNEQFKPGDRIQGYLSEVRQTTRGPQIIMSRTDPRYLVKLFAVEVPEIYDGIIEIKEAAREPGQRAKIAVISKDPAVDPIGACVGMKGSRVQNIVRELRGEKIDIIHWEEDPARFASNALAPAEISKIFVDEDENQMEVIVPDSQLSLAIGRKGQNVRLATKLTGWRIDITSEADLAKRTAEAIFNLMLADGINETMAQNIFQSGFNSFMDLAAATSEQVMGIPGYEDEAKATDLIQKCKDLVAHYEKEGTPIPQAPTAEVKQEEPTGADAKAQAEERLKEEMQQLLGEEESEPEEAVEAATESAEEDAPTAEESSTIEEEVVEAVEAEAGDEEQEE